MPFLSPEHNSTLIPLPCIFLAHLAGTWKGHIADHYGNGMAFWVKISDARHLFRNEVRNCFAHFLQYSIKVSVVIFYEAH